MWRRVILPILVRSEPVLCFWKGLSSSITHCDVRFTKYVAFFVEAWTWAQSLSLQTNSIIAQPLRKSLLKAQVAKGPNRVIRPRPWLQLVLLPSVINQIDVQLLHLSPAHTKTVLFVWSIGIASLYVFAELAHDLVL